MIRAHRSPSSGRRQRQLVAVLLSVALVGAACSSDDAGDVVRGEDADLRIAFFAASSQNGFNAAVYEGIEAKAGEIGNVDVQIFDGEFDAETQFNQVQDATASGNFDGFVVLPNDTVGIAAAVEEAIGAGHGVVTTLFPMGPELDTLEPQVEGLVSTVGVVPADGARLMAEEVVEFCQDKDPCRVVVMVGQLQFPFDNARNDAFREVLDEHDNIEVVATGEGNYDRDTALTAMTDILQANPEVDAVLSGADQHLFGVETALADAGIPTEDLYLIGLGAAEQAVAKIRSGEWDATKADYPHTMGELALEQLVNALRGDPVQEAINMDEVAPLAPILTTEILEENPDFEGEFEG